MRKAKIVRVADDVDDVVAAETENVVPAESVASARK